MECALSKRELRDLGALRHDGLVQRADLTARLSFGPSDWVLCLEVAEHIPRAHEEAFRRVRRWTRHVDVFAKRFVVVPINEDLHWSVAVLCNLDSLPRAAAEAAPPLDDTWRGAAPARDATCSICFEPAKTFPFVPKQPSFFPA